jgi:DNA-binding NarL/FixJ family response regulator
MSGTPLIGRAAELDAISSAWTGANTNTTTVLITGEAGSGKSRLVAEAIERLSPQPAVVLSGAARTHGPAPYDWLASVLTGRNLSELNVEPDVLGWLTQRGGTARPAPATMLRAATAVVRALLAGKRGLLLVEDLHDLDPASLTLIAELVGTASSALVLVTSRSPHEAAFPPVAGRTLRRLAGAPNLVRLHLSPFGPRETADLVEACCGTTPGPETVRALHTRTGGNPFWLTELICANGPPTDPDRLAGARLPTHLAAMLVERLDGEPARVGNVARTAALLCDPTDGEQLHVDQLQAVCGEDVEPVLRRLVELGMLVVSADGPLHFRTPLIREALAAAILPDERSRIHRRAYTFAVELSDDDARARHAAALGRRILAERAARRAVDKHRARPEAVLAAATIGLATSEDPKPFLRTGSSAALAIGRFALAAEYATQLVDLATGLVERADAHRQAALASWHLGDLEGFATNFAAASKFTGEAYDQRASGAAACRARQLAAEAASLLRAVPAADVIPAAESALAAAVETGEASAEAHATVALGAALMRTGEPERGLGLLRAGRRLAEREHDLIAVGWALNFLAAARQGWSPYEDALAASAALGLQFNVGKITRIGYEHSLRAGDLARAESLVWGRLPIETDPLDALRFTAAAGLLALERGDDALAARMLARANTVLGRPWTARVAAMLAVAVASRSGRPDEAGSALQVYVESLPADQHLARPHRLAEAARWALRGGALADDVEALVLATAPDALAGRSGAQLRLLLTGDDELAASLASAALDGPPEVAWQDAEVHAALAQVLVRLGRPGEARDHAERAVALLHRWPGWRRESAEALLHSLRASGDLTAREIEVLGCLAAGMSNQQVARSLGISIRTVAVHVSNLLRKTGAASRTEAALWAVRHQLARGR